MNTRVDGEKLLLQCEERLISRIRKLQCRLQFSAVRPKTNSAPSESKRRQSLLVADELGFNLNISTVV